MDKQDNCHQFLLRIGGKDYIRINMKGNSVEEAEDNFWNTIEFKYQESFKLKKKCRKV